MFSLRQAGNIVIHRSRSPQLRAACIATAWIVYIGLALWTQSQVNPQFTSDVGIYIDAGQRSMSGLNPYAQFKIGTSFVYPPIALLIFAPLAMLPLAAAKLVWAALTVAAYLACIKLIWSMLPPMAQQARAFRRLSIALLLYAPLWETITVGQINVFVLLGILLFVARYSNDRSWIGDLALACAIAIKMTPALLLILPILNHEWRRCIRIFGALAILALASLSVFGSMPWREFIMVLPELLQGVPSALNQAPEPTLATLISSAYVPASWVGRFFSLGVIVGWIGIVYKRRGKTATVTLAALGVTTMTISSSLIWYHHLVFLVFPLTMLLLDQRSARHHTLQSSAIVALGLIQVDRWFELNMALVPICAMLGYLLVYAACVVRALDDPASGSQ